MGILFYRPPTETVFLDSFEYSGGWSDTLPDNLINPTLDFSSAESVLQDSFETSDNWP